MAVHHDASFTCSGDFGNYYALLCIDSFDEPILLNGKFMEGRQIILTPPGWKYAVTFPARYGDMLFLWHRDLFEKYLYKNHLEELIFESRKSMVWSDKTVVYGLFKKMESYFCDSGFQMDQTLESSLETFLDFYRKNTQSFKWSSSQETLAHSAFELFVDHWRNGINVAEACEKMNISRRSLEMSYKALWGTSPGQHLKMIKLFGVRKELILNIGTESISSILMRNGINHFGHFGSLYKSIFKENMKETLFRTKPTLLKENNLDCSGRTNCPVCEDCPLS